MSTTAVRTVSEQDFPGTLPIEQQLRFLLRYAVLAPSARNAQPWRFAVDADHVLLWADPTRSQPVADPDQRELYLGVGCALENLLVAAEHFGFRHHAEYFPAPGDERLVAVVRFGPGGGRARERAAIRLETLLHRRTAHGAFGRTVPPAPALALLETAARDARIVVRFTDAGGVRQAVERLYAAATEAQLARAEYRRELAEAIGQGNFGTPWPLSAFGRLAMTHLSLARRLEAADLAALQSAPVLALIAAPGDDHQDHVRSGQVLERVWLTATELGLGLQPASALIEVPETRAQLGALFGLPADLLPQELVRIGVPLGGREALTPRRPAEEVAEG